MTIKEYLKKYEISQNQLSRDLGIVPATISCILNGVRITSLRNVILLHEYTGGEVSIESIIKPIRNESRFQSANTIGEIRRREYHTRKDNEARIALLNKSASS